MTPVVFETATEKKKRIERWFVENSRRVAPLVPEGKLDDFEKPDFKLETSGGLVGIEVTEILRENARGPYKPVAEADLHEEAVEFAEELYRKSGAPPVRVLTYLTNDWPQPRRARDIGKTLFEFVLSRNTDFGVYSKRKTPAGFDVIAINPPDGQPWASCGSASPGPLERTRVEAAIRDKEKLLPKYRANLPGAPIWLFIHISVTTSRYVVLPFDANTWKFESAFDRVILFDYPERQVFDMGQNQRRED